MEHAVGDEFAHDQADVVGQRWGESIGEARAEVVAGDSRCLAIGGDLERQWGKRLDACEMPVGA